MKSIFVCILIVVAYVQGIANDVKIYPFPEGLAPAKDFKATINGKEAFVYDSPVGALIHFEADKSVAIEITLLDLAVKRVDVRPKSLNVKYELAGNILKISIPAGANVSVEFNGKTNRPIFIFANLPDAKKPKHTDAGVLYYKGGKVYEVGQVELKDNQQVYIEGGAVVHGSFKASNAKNVIISGPGIIDGTNVRGEEDYREAVKNYRNWRKLVHFYHCKDSKISNVILLNSNTWNIVPDNSDHIVIDNIRIVCGNPSDDGIDILQSSNVTIKNSFIRSKDDCIVLKSLFETKPDKIVSNILIENCTLWSAEWGNAMEIGFETLTARIENVVFKNITVIHEEGGAVFSIHNTDYALIKNIHYENITIEDATDKLIDIGIFVSLFSKDNPYEVDDFKQNHYLKGPWDNALKMSNADVSRFSASRGKVENITFTNIQITGFFPYSIIQGYDSAHMVSDITINNLRVNNNLIKNAEDAKIHTAFAKNIQIQ